MKRRTFLKGSATASLLSLLGFGSDSYTPVKSTLKKTTGLPFEKTTRPCYVTDELVDRVYWEIKAVDSQHFAEMVQNNQEGIVQILRKAYKRKS